MRTGTWMMGAALVLGTVGCEERGVLSGGDSDLPGADGDTDGRGDTSDTSGDGGGDGPAVWHHVIGAIEILPSDEGLDLDGDGDVDNALGFLAEWIPTDRVPEFLASADSQLILQFWGVDDGDAQLAVGALQGVDSDEDPADNYDNETYQVAGQLLPTGRARVSVQTRLDGDGVFRAELPAAPIDLGVFQIPTAAPWTVVGQPTEEDVIGILATAVSIEDLADILRANNLGFLVAQLGGIADLDLDGNGEGDAISIAVGYGGVPCQVEAVGE